MCVSVAILGCYLSTYKFKVRYQQLINDVLEIVNSWISLENFCSSYGIIFLTNEHSQRAQGRKSSVGTEMDREKALVGLGISEYKS